MDSLTANLFYISIIAIFIIDVSGFVQEAKRFLVSKKIIQNIHTSLKPFDCSLCMTWWSGILYLIVSCNFSLFGFFVLSVLAAMTSAVAAIMLFAVDAVKMLIDMFYNYIKSLLE